MTLTEAKNIADVCSRPHSHSTDALRVALARLERTKNNQLSDRAWKRWNRRVNALIDAISQASKPFQYDEAKMFPFATNRHMTTD
jgi:hypothetical protein